MNNLIPYSVYRAQKIEKWDGWGSADCATLPEESNLSDEESLLGNDEEIDQLVKALFE